MGIVDTAVAVFLGVVAAGVLAVGALAAYTKISMVRVNRKREDILNGIIQRIKDEAAKVAPEEEE